ncbi:flagellar protein FlaG [Desulfuromonas acetoxidans]|uniref:Flagellar protein FlaG protein n=1 Tax=Desulfuromonas acetoxidans (strain DSM 684 / 11070) TaxID=281689 RepID=Q1JZP7_DESA6|nr:flagellar protein FlaG [Desulfuromonas acetoxidans]EAT15845.1 flagellar protein FlaG protein [Desulfuromonas acetoxidans DSM 684]MBF0644953.1 flagellar protein FlaG [Desulfuromonas acetoxidans]NVD25610.1 flagellar protein FlaG [Desulfuromonas acetoxidans]NVE17662.1 flagellar protein FlaG [Desulfuromonas acetoxidans]
MEIQAVGLTSVAQQSVPNKSSEDIEMSRKAKDYEAASEQASAAEANKVQPEELLNQIKSLTEDGVYSVRFENDDDANQLVVKVVDSKTDEVIRQVPAEEVLSLSVRLEELRGNIVNTEG